MLFNKSTKYSEPIAVIKIGRLLIVKKKVKNWSKVSTKDFIGWVTNENLWGY